MYDRKECLHDALFTQDVTSYPVYVYVPPTMAVALNLYGPNIRYLRVL